MLNSYVLDRHVSYLERSGCCVCICVFAERPGQPAGINKLVSAEKKRLKDDI